MINKKFVLFFAHLFICHCLLAQTEIEREKILSSYNVSKLNQMAREFSEQFKDEQEIAFRYAREHNIPIIKKLPDGGVAVLQKILDNGTLIYNTTENRGASITTRTNQLYEGGNLNVAVHGENMLIGLWDGGRVLNSHELFENRVLQMDNAVVNSDHATHVTGTLIGSEQPQNGAARGMAFEAEAWAYDFNNDLAEITAFASQGFLLSNHSYGYSAEELPLFYFGAYDAKAAAIDDILYTAPNYLMVVSAGNDRGYGYNAADGGYDLLTDMSVAKNNLVVAAVQGIPVYMGPSSVNMAVFSSFGPTDDGRIKPDISAKGVNVFSSTAESNSSYANFSGTSMASPNVSGSLLLLQQLHNNLYGGFMKASTLKAMTIHTASEAGAHPGPDYRFGWGLLNTEGAARIMLEKGFRADFEENTLAQDEIYTKEITAAGNMPLVVTIVWADSAGTIQGEVEDDATSRLVNDLDLRMEDESGNISFPWRLNPSNVAAAALKVDNAVDNVEKIQLNQPSGNYTLSVSHKGALSGGAQEYSLIVSGIQNGQFAIIPLSLETSVCDFENALMEFNFLAENGFFEAVELSVTGLPEGANATFNPATINSEGSFELLITNLSGTPTGNYPLSIIATGSSFTREIEVSLNVTNTQQLPDVEIISPSLEEENVFISPTLQWTASSGAEYYIVEVSTDPEFTSIFLSTNTETESYTVNGLFTETEYFWRVRPRGNCAEGNYAIGSFTTETLQCDELVISTDTPKTILSIPNVVFSEIIIPEEEDFVVGDVNVFVDIAHTYVGDFDLVLTSPSGTQVVLISNECGSGDDISATFDDTGSAVECASISPVIYGNFQPLEPLSSFIGEQAAGNWQLSISDEINGDGGVLNEFSLLFCKSGVLSVPGHEIRDLKLYPNPATDFFEISFPGADGKTEISVYDLKGSLIFIRNFEINGNFKENFDVGTLTRGLYFVNIDNGHKKAVKKLIIK